MQVSRSYTPMIKIVSLCTLALCTIVVFLFTSAESVFAAPSHSSGKLFVTHPSSKDPLVFAAKDVTQGANCKLTIKINTYTHPLSKVVPCPAGTIIAPEEIPQSQALAKHEPFVSYTDTSVANTRSMQHRLTQQLQSNIPLNKLLPFTACGNGGSASVRWTARSIFDNSFVADLPSTEPFFRSSSCSTVSLNTASIHVNSVYQNNTVYWHHDQYQGGWFGVPDYPSLNGGGTYSHSVNQNWDTGYYYETWVIDEWEGSLGINGEYCNILID